jgi:glycosyl transferase family 25
MRVLVINLAAAVDRLALQDAQMRALGLQWERIQAVTPATVEPAVHDPVWHRWQRPLRLTEIALLASHVRAWRRVRDLRSPCLILEDDALLATSAPAFLDAAAKLAGIDHISLETRGRKKTVSRTLDPRAPMRRLWQDRTGSAAYVVWPAGAEKLLARAARGGGPSDAVISSTYALRSFQADPALAIQLDRCTAYGVPQPIATASSIDAMKKPRVATNEYSIGERIGFRARRAFAQVRIASRRFARPFATERRHILPATDWPTLTVPVAGAGVAVQ